MVPTGGAFGTELVGEKIPVEGAAQLFNVWATRDTAHAKQTQCLLGPPLRAGA